MTFGAESWAVTNKPEQSEWRGKENPEKIYRPTYEGDYWGIKMNEEIYSKFKYSDIVTVIIARRLEWLGHVVRVDGERMV